MKQKTKRKQITEKPQSRFLMNESRSWTYKRYKIKKGLSKVSKYKI